MVTLCTTHCPYTNTHTLTYLERDHQGLALEFAPVGLQSNLPNESLLDCDGEVKKVQGIPFHLDVLELELATPDGQLRYI
jgi:hypothetical protein